ncbi:MAG: hypothetical protein WCM76_16520 [Bacteroidota bacterium]
MKPQIKNGNTIWLLCCFSFVFLLTFCSLNIPFFWDSVTFSKIAGLFYSNGFNGFIVPETSDTGGFPLYGAYIAAGWMLFGKSLAVSHLLFLPFLVGVVWEFYKLCKRFLPEAYIPVALVFLCAEPCFVTQGMLMAYDVILLYLLLLATNCLLNGKYIVYSVSLIFIGLISVRGLMALPALAIVHGILIFYFKERRFTYADILVYLPVIAVFIVWILWHKQQTGWYFLSPMLEGTDQKLVGAAMMFRQFIYVLWKIADFGRVFIWLTIPLLAFLFRKQLRGKPDFKLLLIFLLLPLLVNMLFMVPISNPVGQRYFMFTYIILIITVTYIIRFMQKRMFRIGVIIGLLAAMISGNIWLWPEKYGNGWDCSLKVLPFFKIEKQARLFVVSHQINPVDIATDFPLQADAVNTYLADKSFHYSDKGTVPLRSFKYILHSNISNKFSPAEMSELEQQWKIIFSASQWPVYLRIYKNPE